MPETLDLPALVAQIPDLDKAVPDAKDPTKLNRTDEGKVTGPAWPAAGKTFDAALAGGKDALIGLIALLKDVDNGEDYKVRHLLHGIAVYVCRAGKEEQHALVVDAFASQLAGNRSKPVTAFLIHELRFIGAKAAAPALGKLLLDPELGDPAMMALVGIRDGAVEQFRAALPNASGKQRLAILQALGVLRDPQAVPVFMQAAGDTDLNTRLAALWGLANLGERTAVDTLIKAASAPPGWERNKATQACLLLAENLLAAGCKPEAVKLYQYLADSRTDATERYVRDAAVKALAAAK